MQFVYLSIIFNTLKMAFRLKSVTELRKVLGQYDAVVQLTEISVRNFMEKANEHSSIQEYITEQSKKYNIRTNDVEVDILMNRLSLQYIASVQQYAELFFYKFKTEYEELYDHKMEFGDSNDTFLEKLLTKLPYNKEVLLSEVGQIHYDIIKYYKKVRNKYSHYFQISDDSLQSDFQNLIIKKDEINEKYDLFDAPNDYENLCFNDFILFTRALKYFANNLCDFIKPSDDIIINHLKRKNFKLNLLHKEERYKNALKSYLLQEYGINDLNINYIYTALVA